MIIDSVLLVLLGLEFAAFVVFFLLLWVSWQRLIDHQHEHYYEEWCKDGRPSGGRRTRKEIGFWTRSNDYSAYSLLSAWRRNTPEWALGDVTALCHLADVRRYFTASYVSILLVFPTFLGLMKVTDNM